MGRVQDDAVSVFDEPTIGPHPLDVQVLAECVRRPAAKGAICYFAIENTISTLSVTPDYATSMGPGGGDAGGKRLCWHAERYRSSSKSITGRYL